MADITSSSIFIKRLKQHQHGKGASGSNKTYDRTSHHPTDLAGRIFPTFSEMHPFLINYLHSVILREIGNRGIET